MVAASRFPTNGGQLSQVGGHGMYQRLWKEVVSTDPLVERWHCALIVDGRVVGSGMAQCHPADSRPDASASSLAFHDFNRRMGRDIRYDNPNDAPPKGTKD